MRLSDPLATKDKLWHKMREDLALYVPEVRDNKLLMCCACGRFLPQDAFTFEHLIPQRALKDDPEEVKVQATANERGGNILLCGEALYVKSRGINKNGCNGWKGTHFDGPIQDIFNGKAFDQHARKVTQRHTIASNALAFLAMVRHYGYQVAITPTGAMLRRQFFSPSVYVKGMPDYAQVLLGGARLEYEEGSLPFWADPYHFILENGRCIVTIRNVALALPIWRDPSTPLAKHLPFAPLKYKMALDIRSFADRAPQSTAKI